MKKNHKYEAWYYHALKKTFLVMRIVIVISLVFIMQSFALESFTQNSKISLNVKGMKLEDIMMRIEDQTKYRFAYNKTEVDVDKSYSVDINNAEIKELLDKLFLKGDVNYNIIDRQIVLSSAKEPSVSQQQKSISGKVSDSEGTPLPGVTIMIKGTAKGIITDGEGNYSLSDVPDDATLVFSFVGMKTQEVKVTGKSLVDISLTEETVGIDEVVAIGYGSDSKVRVNGAVSKIKSESLQSYASGNFDQAMTGKISGVIVNQTGRNPGDDSQIVIRGTGTLTAGSNPLIVVDGLPLSEGSSLSSINTKDIESIDILKDAASAAIFGSRAANGVILVTTKKAMSGKLQVSFDVQSGVQQRSDKVELVDAYDAAIWFKEARDWGYVSKNPSVRKVTDDYATRLANGASKRELPLTYTQPYLDGTPGLTNTDWYDEIYRVAKYNDYHMSVNGGGEKSNFYAALGYLNQESIVVGSDYERFTLNMKMDSELSKRIKFGINTNTSYSTTNKVGNGGWNFPADPVDMGYVAYPFFPVYNADGSFALSEQIEASTPEDGALLENPVAMMLMSKNSQSDFRVFGNAYAEFQLTDYLTFKTSVGGDFRSSFLDYFQPSSIGQYRTHVGNLVAHSSETNIRAEDYIIDNTFNFNKKFNKHIFNGLLGYSYEQQTGINSLLSANGFIDNSIDNVAGGSNFAFTGNRYKWTQISYIGRVKYNYDERYLIDATFRRDGSSRFGKNSKWGTFPSFSLGWIVSNESFFAKNKLVNYLKLRASWGSTGNNQIGAYSSQALVKTDNYVFNGALATGLASTTSPNANLSWETNKSYNIGVDFGLLKNKLNFSTNYYSSTTSDLLLEVPVPEQSGFSSSLQNIGKVKNSGFEFEFSGQNFKVGEVGISFNANLTTLQNKVLALGPGQDQIITGSNNAFRTRVGGPVAEYYGYEVTGVYKTQEEINNSPHMDGTLTGDYIVKDITADGKITTDDRRGFGTYAPDFTYAFGANLNFKNFDFSFSFVGVEGRKVYERMLYTFLEVGEGFSMADQYYFDHRYHPVDNPDGFMAQPNLGNFSNNRKNTRASNIFFNDADYLRLQSIQLGYTIKSNTLQKLGLAKSRIYLTANNLISFNKYRGMNPEATLANPLRQGDVNANLPSIPKTITAGLNITF
jgi:TonB-linked SusC/RagA family outer membrane protein